mgnify:CR=1 FL=1
MAKAAKHSRRRPTIAERLTQLEHHYTHLHRHQERLIMTAQDLQTAVDALTAAVTKVQTEVTALKNTPPLMTQEQLDKATADVTAATATLSAL